MGIDDNEHGHKCLIFIVALFIASLAVMMLILFGYPYGYVVPHVALPILIVIGVATLLASLTTASYILHQLGLGNKNEALGLPTGSVRAIIALCLILIFAISVIFMYGYLDNPRQTEVIITETTTIGNATLGTGNVTTITNITKISGPSEASIDFAKQTLTTVGTLVVAVAAFYFGTRAVQVARGSEQIADLFIEPSGEKQLLVGGELPIVVKGTPEDELITCTVEGDDSKSVTKETAYRFKYKPKVTEDKTVTLTFKMPKYSDVKPQILTVQVKKKNNS